MEKLVRNKLKRLPNEYVTINDLWFENNGRSTQIDHVVVSPYGVFVIETKGYSGWILGGEDAGYWTQVIYRSKHKFYNPIMQNDGHVRFLQHLLGCGYDIPFMPIVVFSDATTLKVRVSSHMVVNLRKLKTSILSQDKVSINQTTIDWIVKTINDNLSAVDRETTKRHKKHVKDRQQRAIELIKGGICPRCGGNLVLRKGRYGNFYGCSNYPNCRFTVSRH